MALSDPQSILASPLAIIEREGGPSDIETILELARQNQVERIIVGLPLSMDGTVGQQAEKVKVFTIGKDSDIFSKEICGVPHVKNTSELGKFKIKKEQSSSSGVRRIKAVLE